MGKIIINGLQIMAYHGVNPAEKEDGQIFEIDLSATLNMTKAFLSDEITDTVSYASVIKTIKRVMTGRKYDLLERAVYVIAEALFLEYEPIQKIRITLKKPDAPIKASFRYVAVQAEFDAATFRYGEAPADTGEQQPSVPANAAPGRTERTSIFTIP